MRKQFANLLYNEMAENKDIYLLTGDLGYGLWDKIRDDYSERFFNVGSAEQLLIGTACGLAMEGKVPVVYSITPFLLARPFEFIRNYVDHEEIPIKLVGGGRGKDYGYLGFSHWACDDEKIMSVFNNILKYRPMHEYQLKSLFNEFISSKRPAYMNLER